jgi:hypothetical protein
MIRQAPFTELLMPIHRTKHGVSNETKAVVATELFVLGAYAAASQCVWLAT